MSFDPRLSSFSDAPSEELYPAEDAELTLADWLLFLGRTFSLSLCLIGVISTLIMLIRSSVRRRLKTWPLYTIVSLLVLSWTALSVVQDHADEYWLHILYRHPQRQSLVFGCRHLLQGVALYLAVLLMAHLSDLQHRGVWLYLVACVVILPLIYTLLVLVLDLHLLPESRQSWQWNLGLRLLRVLLYNVTTSGLILFFAPRFCSGRLSGSYSARRSALPLFLTRLSSTLLILHNLASIISFICTCLVSLPLSLASSTFDLLLMLHRINEELAFLLVALALPLALPMVFVVAKMCGEEGEDGNKMEMDPIEKIYQEQMWTTNSHEPRKGRMSSLEPMSGPETSSTNSLDSISRRENIDNDPNGFAAKRRNRQSYMEAVSMGSLDQERVSVTSEPIDL